MPVFPGFDCHQFPKRKCWKCKQNKKCLCLAAAKTEFRTTFSIRKVGQRRNSPSGFYDFVRNSLRWLRFVFVTILPTKRFSTASGNEVFTARHAPLSFSTQRSHRYVRFLPLHGHAPLNLSTKRSHRHATN